MNKKVIFVAGADHSGSTLIGCILGAHPNPFRFFHVGEIHAFFRQKHKNFGNPRSASKMMYGEFWNTIDPKVGYEQAYQEIFFKSKTNTIIDSSKSFIHLNNVISYCEREQLPLHIIVTYRPFDKIWKSDIKRKHQPSKVATNLSGYIKITEKLSILKKYPYTIINVEQLIMNPRKMTQVLCHAVGIPYFAGKEKYWNYPSIHLYGSTTQRKHLNNPKPVMIQIEC